VNAITKTRVVSVTKMIATDVEDVNSVSINKNDSQSESEDGRNTTDDETDD
jgi:hypothetical protein